MRKVPMWTLVLLLSLTGASGGAPSTAGAQTTPSARPSAAAAAPLATATDLQAVLDQRVRDAPGVGIIVGVVDGDKTTLYSAGTSGTSRPLDEHTLFEIGSVTKTFTATILAGMVLDGTVKLDDPVSKYLPSSVHVPSRDGKQITLLNLATQHSGLPRLPSNLNPADPADPYADYTIANLYQFLGSYKLTRDPGTQFEYSNLGVGLLGDALANRARMPYSQLLKSRVLAPLSMDETLISVPPGPLARLAVGHDADGGPAKQWTFQAIAPAGAIVSSLSDMLKYLRANMWQGPLAKVCLFAQQPRDSLPGAQIGLVWWTGADTHIVHHGGDTAGYHAWLAISPDHAKGSVVLTNGGTSVQDIALHAIDVAFPVASQPAVAQLDPATLDSYAGTYNGSGGLTFSLTRSGDKLMARLSGQDAYRIYPTAKDHFYYRIVDAKIDFTRDSAGALNALVLHQGGKNLIFVRSGMTAPPASAAEPSYPPVVELDAQTLHGYLGSYLAAAGLAFTVTLKGDALMVQLSGQPSFQVYPSARDHFFYKVVDAQIDFERDAGGHVKDMVLHQNGLTITATRQ